MIMSATDVCVAEPLTVTAFALPRKDYFRAESLGEGSYGSVVVVYDEDGASFAAKMFEDDTDADGSGSAYEADCSDESRDDDHSYESLENTCGIDVGVLRELSVLRLLNGAHPNIMRMIDVTEMEGKLTMIMPRAESNLSDAIEKQKLSCAQKVRVAVLLLDALEFLASNSLMHRDIKSDNILLDCDFIPVITDFSLSKAVEVVASTAKINVWKAKSGRKKTGMALASEGIGEGLHTCGAGTPTYTAPEVVYGNGSYNCKADVWSMGVVFYELFNGKMLEEVKDKHAFALLEKVRAKLSEKHPVPATMKRMLHVDPVKRASASEALACILPAGKVDLPQRGRLMDMAGLLLNEAVDGAQVSCELTPSRACELLGIMSGVAARAAESYWRRSVCARSLGPVGAAICALIASKIYEVDLHSSDEIADLHPCLCDYDTNAYAGDELSILNELEFCLAAP